MRVVKREPIRLNEQVDVISGINQMMGELEQDYTHVQLLSIDGVDITVAAPHLNSPILINKNLRSEIASIYGRDPGTAAVIGLFLDENMEEIEFEDSKGVRYKGLGNANL